MQSFLANEGTSDTVSYTPVQIHCSGEDLHIEDPTIVGRGFREPPRGVYWWLQRWS